MKSLGRVRKVQVIVYSKYDESKANKKFSQQISRQMIRGGAVSVEQEGEQMSFYVNDVPLSQLVDITNIQIKHFISWYGDKLVIRAIQK